MVGDRSNPQVCLTDIDLSYRSEYSLVSVGAMPDPQPNPRMPGLYYPGTAWSLLVLVRPQDVGAPQPDIYLR
jgi:hypothetical protein